MAVRVRRFSILIAVLALAATFASPSFSGSRDNDPPAAIILDLLMPGIIGSSVLAYLTSRPVLADVPVAIVSSSPHLAPAGYPLFKKPLQFAPLLEFVRTACDSRRPAQPC